MLHTPDPLEGILLVHSGQPKGIEWGRERVKKKKQQRKNRIVGRKIEMGKRQKKNEQYTL